MRTIVKGKSLEVTDGLRSYAERKAGRLERYLDDRSEAVFELSVEHHRSTDASHIVDVALDVDGQLLTGRAAAATHQAAIDEVIDKLERQAIDQRKKQRNRSRATEEKDILRQIADGTAEPGREPRVVKTKRFAIEPMFEEDAITRMQELGHRFFVFVNAENERIGILYLRTDGDYGLIEPMIGGDYTPGRGRSSASR